MNRRRQDERRKEVSAPKQKQNAELNSSDTSKSLMDNYFESQKAISNYDSPATETKITKSFKIPKKQLAPIEPVRNDVHKNPVNDDSNNRANDDRRSRPRDVCRSPRRDFDRKRIEDNHGTRGNEESRRNIFDRKTETNGNDKRSPIRRNTERDREARKLEDRRREEGNSKRPRSSENRVSPNRHSSREIKRRDEKPRTPSPNVAKRPRLDSSPSRRRSPPPLPGRNNTDKRKNWRKPIELIITDLSSSDGTISPENAEIFLNEIQKSVAERILTDPIHQTKFIGHRHEEGFIFLTCANDFTVSFMQQKLKEEPTLWPSAQLKCNESTHKTTPVYVRLPNSLGFRHFSEFFDACKKSDSRMCTPRWWCIECWDTDDESGRWFKLGIDSESFDLIKRQGRKLICGNTEIPVETVVRRKRQKRIES